MDNGHTVLSSVVERAAERLLHDSPISLGKSTFFRGCNIYHTQSVIRQSVHMTAQVRNDDDRVTSPDFKAAFLERFQQLPYCAQTYGQRNIEDRIFSDKGVHLDQILLEAILAVEAAVAISAHKFEPIKFAIIEEQTDHSNLIWETTSSRLSRPAAEVAFMGVLELLQTQIRPSGECQSEFETSFEALLRTARRKRPTLTTSLMKYVAEQRGLPVKILSRYEMRVGQGRAQRHLMASMTDTTSAVAHNFCWDKRAANRRLRELRLPVPSHVRVTSVEAARDAAEKLGFPVVIKPVKGSGGKGITSKITSHEEIEAACLRALHISSDALVEEFVQGLDHRLSVIGGKFAGGICRRPPMIVGDGEKTVRELIDDLNSDPLRNGIVMIKVDYDDEVEKMLKQEGLTLDSVMAEGVTCPLRLVSNVGMGAVPEDCTDLVHEDNRELAERVAKGFFLDVAGIDFITPDVSRSYREVGGRVIEVNSRPGLEMHTWPARGTSRNLAAKVLDRVYPPGEDGRIPIAVVAGDRGSGTVARLLDQLLRACEKSSGLSLREAAYVNGKASDFKMEEKRVLPTTLLGHPDVEILISAISLRRIAQRGLQMDSCSLAIVLDRNKEGNADLFHTGISVMERATADVFVVGCGNQLALEHLKNLGKRKLMLVGNRITDRLVKEHLRGGGTVIADGWTNDGDRLVMMTGERKIAQFPLDPTWPRLTKGRARKLRRATKYAIAAACGLGIPVADISAALESSSGA